MRRSLLYAATVAALFIAALVANLRLAGTSPVAWLDTFNDESEVRQCLAGNSCTLTGVSTSIPGQVHAVAWLELRTLLAWLGVGLSGAHLVHLVLNAVAATLVFHVATQLGGRLAGATAVWILLVDLGHAGGLRSLFNTNLLPSLGTVLVLACTAVIDRPGVASVSFAALVAAVLANVHLSCIVSGVSVLWVALLAPRRRLLLAGFGAALFALATIAVAPPSWLHNFTSLLQHEEASRGTIVVVTWQRNELILWALFAAAAWIVSLRSRAIMWVEYRRRSQGALAVLVPFLAAFLLAPLFGVHANTKYLAHLKAACAIAAALPLGLVAGALLRRVSPGLLGAVEQLVPFVVALVIAVPGVAERSIGAHVAYFKRAAASLAETADDERTPTIGDLEVVSHVLHDEHGWDVRHMLENFTSPYGTNVLTALPLLGAADNAPSRGAADVGTSVVLIMLESDELPQPLPSSWKIVCRVAHAATVLVVMQSRIDWSRFTVCQRPDGAAQQCAESGWQLDEGAATFAVPHMPPAGVGWRGTLTLRLALRPAVRGSSEEIFMPRMPRVCGGHVASVSGSAAQVDSDRRHATLSAAEPGGTIAAAALELEWDIGAPECEGGASGAYDGLPPFIIAGDAANVQLLEAILRKRED